MTADPPGGSYIDAILLALRAARQQIQTLLGLVESAERAPGPTWKWQLLAAASDAGESARASLDDAEAQLVSLGAPDRLPAVLDALPERVTAMRDELASAREMLEAARARASTVAVGKA